MSLKKKKKDLLLREAIVQHGIKIILPQMVVKSQGNFSSNFWSIYFFIDIWKEDFCFLTEGFVLCTMAMNYCQIQTFKLELISMTRQLLGGFFLR